MITVRGKQIENSLLDPVKIAIRRDFLIRRLRTLESIEVERRAGCKNPTLASSTPSSSTTLGALPGAEGVCMATPNQTSHTNPV